MVTKVVMLVQLTITLLVATKLAAFVQPKPHCADTKCGNLSIPFPFGTSPDCYLDDSFLINCSTNAVANSPKPYLRKSNVEVLDINASFNGEMRILYPSTRACFNLSSGSLIYDSSSSSVYSPWFTLSKFRVSSARNKFTAIGCATNAVMYGYMDKTYASGCVTLCDRATVVQDGSCSGDGCCQAPIPERVQDYQMSLTSFQLANMPINKFNSCSYAFIVEEEAYKFSSSDLLDLQGRTFFPIVLDWAIGNQTCEEAQSNKSSYACQAENTKCINSTNGPGYRCNCSSGYQGNPYLLGGCQDIDECLDPTTCGHESKCKNSVGSFSCSCQTGYRYDSESKSCRENTFGFNWRNIGLGISISLLVLLVTSSWVYLMLQKRKHMKLKEIFFQQNGGFLLKQHTSNRKGPAGTSVIFTTEDLKKATNNYTASSVIGQGGYGTVYKGVLPDNTEVAIKKSKISDQSQIEQFINEVVILSQINHRNVVKLLGCCLETEVPLLVYEFITNGTLSDHIHNESRKSSLSWEMRLKIATEAAGALAYLHFSTTTPIIHRDIKSTNILLDDHYTTKVADFGASRLVPLDKTQLTTLVQGTFGYLDPEYFHSSQLTEKSDVYSFGVLLAELLTGEKALSFDRPENARNLAMHFVSSMKEDRLFDILDDRLKKEANVEQLEEVAMLGKRCLRVKGEDRPTMKEVAMELEGIRIMERHSLVKDGLNIEESEHLLSEDLSADDDNSLVGMGNGSLTAVYNSMRDQIIEPFQFR